MSTSLEKFELTDRFRTPLYSVSEGARYLDVPVSTFDTWAHGYRRQPHGRPPVFGAPLLATLPRASRRGPEVPFVGLAQGLALAAIRRSGVPLQRIRPALVEMGKEFGLEYALASRRLYTDGAEVLFDYALTRGADEGAAHAARELVVVRNGQRVFNDVVASYLRRLDFRNDEYPWLVGLPAYRPGSVVADPTRGFGQPVFATGGARVEDVLSMFRAGEPLDVVSDEYGVPIEDLEDVVRVATRTAA
ncbi:DUF433 domain-containing protein [Actinomycetospora sp. NBRC 106378]|uniref:DUF433 domain-containing protein n=1 Tax=Actinomycetospora sp. NBRC 106378 TaxID=3032208 RepID=UPI0024A379FE|nr:DUF433 domain-containing protein [Actinomycetospora sp. NBRC 106378]GLZ55524.1 putative antitoxin VapB45 [Actinomycetospora sp. NBRC 106378]